MTYEYKLYNFDHGFTKPREIVTGVYKLTIQQIHCDNLERLKQNPAHVYTVDPHFKRVVECRAGTPGETCETAIIEVNKNDVCRSSIYPEIAGRNNIADFSLVMSFLTGRRVYLESEITAPIAILYTSEIVNHKFFIFFNLAWTGLDEINKLGLETQFYNLVQASTIDDLPCISFYGNSILDSVYEKMCRLNNHTKYESKNIIDKARETVIKKLECNVLHGVKKSVIKYLQNNKVDKSEVQDVEARISIPNSPSALFKLKKFLIDLDLYPREDTSEQHARLQWVNKVRNSIAHYGDIPSDGKLSFDKRAEITTAISFLVLSIAQYYFSKVIFKIDNYMIDQNKNDIQSFFKSGMFRGHKVFEESYTEYMNRLESEWIGNGVRT